MGGLRASWVGVAASRKGETVAGCGPREPVSLRTRKRMFFVQEVGDAGRGLDSD